MIENNPTPIEAMLEQVEALKVERKSLGAQRDSGELSDAAFINQSSTLDFRLASLRERIAREEEKKQDKEQEPEQRPEKTVKYERTRDIFHD